MPLILLSGLPSSGKTYRSRQILDEFGRRIAASPSARIRALRLVHVHDGSLGLDRAEYDAGRREKDARAAFASAVKRELSRSTLVVADGLNYIKGYRYQMYCEAKEQGTGSCVVQPAVPPETCRRLNATALEEKTGGYPPAQFDNLVFRHEEPNGLNRWDAPLFVVPFEDAHPPYDAIWEALIEGASGGGGKVVRPHQATVLKKASAEGYLPFLEGTCGDVVRQVETWTKENDRQGGRVGIKLDGIEDQEGEEELFVQLPMDGVRAPQLQRLKRQFVAMNRVTEVSKKRIGRLFVDYLNDAFQE